MNKKKLSVVMAGAMLATSVAPVLAAETTVEKTEVSANNLGLLIKQLEEKLKSAKFADETKTDKERNGALKGKSIYYVVIDGTKYTLDNLAALEAKVKSLKTGNKVQVWTEGFVKETVDGVEKYYAQTNELKYTAEDLKAGKKVATDIAAAKADKTVGTAITNLIASYTPAGDTQTYGTVALNDGTKNTDVKFNISSEDAVLDFTRPLDENGDLLSFANLADSNETTKKGEIDKFDHFDTVKANYQGIENAQLQEITITTGGNDLALSDLYDGLMLTEKGHELLSEVKALKADKVSDPVKVGDMVAGSSKATTPLVAANLKADKEGNYKVAVEIKDSFDNTKTHTYTITSKDASELVKVANWLLAGQANVDLYAGDTRYETAVSIAKDLCKYSDVTDIVLVNGDSLVDGLAAAPLAHSIGVDTPILLTESNDIPTATAKYLKEVIDSSTAIEDLDGITIHIVGGTSVVSKSVEKELKNFGFNVNRYGGANREETSLKVAETVGIPANGAFVVGANGEADAMSIAGYAASEDMPIIVSKAGGLTEEAVEAVEDSKVTVIGGETVVPAEDYKALSESASKIQRIAGKNRKATNAAIIKEYYSVGNTQNVIVAKDDKLVDALAASTLAAKEGAPIVLATNSLSDEQVNAIYYNGSASTAGLYQVGHGVAPSVVKTIAQRLGLAK